MRASDYRCDLPSELIAQYPSESRRESRLLVVEGAGDGIQERRVLAHLRASRSLGVGSRLLMDEGVG